MARSALDALPDAYLDELALGNIMTLCNAEPTTRTQAVTTFALADVTLTPGNGGGDFTIANGDTNGRKVTVTAQSAVPVDVTGTATHVAICDGTRLLFVTTCGSTALTSGGTADIAAFKIEVADPTA